MKESVCRTVCVSGGTKGANRKKKMGKKKKKGKSSCRVLFQFLHPKSRNKQIRKQVWYVPDREVEEASH